MFIGFCVTQVCLLSQEICKHHQILFGMVCNCLDIYQNFLYNISNNKFIMIEVLLQNEPYRYIRREELLENGQPDYRIQKWNNYNGYKDMYLCDNYMQMQTAMEDFEYTKWLDPAGVPCYIKED